MKKTILLFAMIFSLFFLPKKDFAQVPNFIWAKSAGGMDDDFANSITTDASGNIFVTGMFKSASIQFGSTTLTNATTGFADIFLAKYDANGNLLWARSAGGTRFDAALAITTDNSGNALVVGYFLSTTITFSPYTLTNSNSTGNTYDLFIVKYDSNGNVLWAKSAGGESNDEVNSVSTDNSGNIYVAGDFRSDTLNLGSTNLINAGNGLGDMFLAKYDVNGNFLWAKSAGGTSDDRALSISVDASGNNYVTGFFFSPNIVFDTDTFTNAGSITEDIFLIKNDANGNLLWAKSAGGTNDDKAYSIDIDTLGNVYMTGYFSSPTIDFGSTTLTNTNGNIFLTKYNSSGNVLWAKSSGGANGGMAYSVAVDASGSAYVVGWFESSTITFGSTTLTNAGLRDIFLFKYNTNGNALWAKSAGGINRDYGESIALDAFGNTYIAGNFNSPSLTFGSTTLTNTDNTGNTNDIYFARLGSSMGINELSNSLDLSIFPNPVADNINIIIPEKATIIISNINGQIIKTIFSICKSSTVDLTELSSGVYIVRAVTDKEIVTKKFIKE